MKKLYIFYSIFVAPIFGGQISRPKGAFGATGATRATGATGATETNLCKKTIKNTNQLLGRRIHLSDKQKHRRLTLLIKNCPMQYSQSFLRIISNRIHIHLLQW